MARGGVNLKAIGQLIEQEPFDMVWFSYDLGVNFGAKFTTRNTVYGSTSTGISNEVSITKVFKQLSKQEFDGIAGFYVGILCFYGDIVYDKIDFVDKIPKNSINTVVSKAICPNKHKDKIYQICHSNYDFIDFIEAADKLDTTNFDKESAISVYKLQGDACIFKLMCQMFYSNKGIDKVFCSLIPDIPVDFSIEVSNYFSGCHFPVCVSPMVSDFKWECTDDGWFLYGLYDGEWVVMDVAGQGRMNLSNYALANRINFLGSGGRTVPFVVCWSWGEVIDAYHYFGEDLLVRDMNNSLFEHYWFVFGPDSRVCVHFFNGFVNTLPDYRVSVVFDYSVFNPSSGVDYYLIMDLSKQLIDFCERNDVVFSDDEVFDIFEIGSKL